MCRHLGYLGPPVALDELLLRPAHSLLEQTWAPHDMRAGGTVNVDGFGAGWYPQGTGTPTRYRAAVPMGADASFAELASTVSSPAVLGAVRSATVGTPVVRTACAPFTDGTWLFSLNGRVSGWPDSLADLAAKLDTVDLMTLEAPVDSAVVWALLRRRLHQGQPAETAVRDLLHEVVSAASESRMNLMLTDGSVLIATTWTHSLSLWRDHDAVIAASEPFGPGDGADGSPQEATGWEAIPDRHLVVADTGHVSITPLPEAGKP